MTFFSLRWTLECEWHISESGDNPILRCIPELQSRMCTCRFLYNVYMGHALETGTSGHLTCFLLRKAFKMLFS